MVDWLPRYHGMAPKTPRIPRIGHSNGNGEFGLDTLKPAMKVADFKTSISHLNIRAATIVVSSFTFISPVSSSMVAPALTTISKEFGITNEVESQLVLSVFILAYAIGPLFLGPLSEIYGRVPVLQLANLVYLIFNIACGASRNKGEMVAFRFLAGLGGSAPLAVSLFAVATRGSHRDSLTVHSLVGVSLAIVGEPKKEVVRSASTVLLLCLGPPLVP